MHSTSLSYLRLLLITATSSSEKFCIVITLDPGKLSVTANSITTCQYSSKKEKRKGKKNCSNGKVL